MTADKFLACGILEHGFARIWCDASAHDYLLAFSCKRLRLAPVPAYVEHFITLMKKDPSTVSQTDKTAWAQAIIDKASKVKDVTSVTVSATCNYAYRYCASSEGSYIEQELYTTTPSLNVTAKVGDVTQTRNYPGIAGTAGSHCRDETCFSST